MRQYGPPWAARLKKMTLLQLSRRGEYIFGGLSDEPAENRQFRFVAVKHLTLERVNERARLRERQQHGVRIIALMKETPEQLGVA